jgi:hypothetical protein
MSFLPECNNNTTTTASPPRAARCSSSNDELRRQAEEAEKALALLNISDHDNNEKIVAHTSNTTQPAKTRHFKRHPTNSALLGAQQILINDIIDQVSPKQENINNSLNKNKHIDGFREIVLISFVSDNITMVGDCGNFTFYRSIFMSNQKCLHILHKRLSTIVPHAYITIYAGRATDTYYIYFMPYNQAPQQAPHLVTPLLFAPQPFASQPPPPKISIKEEGLLKAQETFIKEFVEPINHKNQDYLNTNLKYQLGFRKTYVISSESDIIHTTINEESFEFSRKKFIENKTFQFKVRERISALIPNAWITFKLGRDDNTFCLCFSQIKK